MKSALAIWLAILISILSTTSCSNNVNKADPNIEVKFLSEYLGKPIEVNIKGKVIGTNQKPIDSATVIVGNRTVSTDKDGNFILKNASAHENLLSVQAQKDGYKSTLVSLTSEKSTNTVNIILHKETELCLFWFCKNNHNLK